MGTGFSYVNKSDAYTKDLAMVASDMMVLLKTFFECHKEFQTIPFYIFSESYGGKMAAGIALELYKATQQGTIQCNFAGVALGDSWISPIEEENHISQKKKVVGLATFLARLSMALAVLSVMVVVNLSKPSPTILFEVRFSALLGTLLVQHVSSRRPRSGRGVSGCRTSPGCHK